MKKKKITVTISEELHEIAIDCAAQFHFTDFSGLITNLLVKEMAGKRPNPGWQLDTKIATAQATLQKLMEQDRAPVQFRKTEASY
jgi:hypothetical protein